MADDKVKARDAGAKAAQTIWQDYYESSPDSSIQDANIPDPNNPRRMLANPKVEAAANYFLVRGRMALDEYGQGLNQGVKAGALSADEATQQMEQFAQGILSDRKRFYEDAPRQFLKAQEAYLTDIFNYNRELTNNEIQASRDEIEADFSAAAEDGRRMIEADVANLDAVKKNILDASDEAIKAGANPKSIDRATRDALSIADSTYFEKLTELAPTSARDELMRVKGSLKKSYGDRFVENLDKKIMSAIDREEKRLDKDVAEAGKLFAKGEQIDANALVERARALGKPELANELNNMKRIQHNLNGASVDQLRDMSAGEDPVEASMARERLDLLASKPLEAIEKGGYAKRLSPVNFLAPDSFAIRSEQVDQAAETLGMDLPLLKKSEEAALVGKLSEKSPRQAVDILNNIESNLDFAGRHRLINQLANSSKGNLSAQVLLANENARQNIIEAANSDVVQGRSLTAVRREAGIWVDKHLKDLSKPLKKAYKGILAAGKANGLDFDEAAEEYAGIIEGNEDRMFIPPVPMSKQESEVLYTRLTEDMPHIKQIGNGMPVGLDGKEIDVEDRDYHPVPSGRPGVYHLIDADTGRKAAVQRKDGDEVVFVAFEMKVAE